MALEAITLSIDPALSAAPAATADSDAACAFCGAAGARWTGYGYLPPGSRIAAACALCCLPQHLERPRIDEEAALVWLPEISQPALNATMRAIHVSLQALGEDVHADAVFRKRATKTLSTLHCARAVLAERRGAAQARVGTASPRELGLALLELSPAAHASRGELLDGVRLLPLGRFFEHDTDIYPEIVGSWRDGTKTGHASPDGAR